MNNLVHADTFFFISSFAFVVFIVLAVTGGTSLILIMNDVKYISKKLRKVSDEIGDDVENIRKGIKEKGQPTRYLIEFFFDRLFKKRKK
jgi:hypothetical protein